MRRAIKRTIQQRESRMSQSIFIQLQMDTGLCARFEQAAARAHQPAEDVLKRLMQDYVSRDLEPCEPPRFAGDDRNLDDLVLQALGWKHSPFGAE